MKKKITSIIVSFIVCLSFINAQIEIHYDFIKSAFVDAKGEITSIKKIINDDDQILLFIEDINLNLYTVTITSESKNYFLTQPSNFPLVLDNSIAESVPESAAGKQSTDDLKFIAAYNSYVESYNNLQVAKSLYKQLEDLLNSTTQYGGNDGIKQRSQLLQSQYTDYFTRPGQNGLTTDCTNKYREAIQIYTDLADKSKVGELKKILDNYNENFISSKFDEIFNNIMSLVNKINDVHNFKVSEVFNANGDDFVIKVVIKAKNDNTLIKEIIIPFFVRKFKVDFSSGIVGSFRVGDRSYSLDSVQQGFQIRENAINSKVKPSICAFMHAYYKFNKYINLGISIGATLSDFENAGFYLGGSILLGKSQRIVLTGGATVQKIDYINGKYHVGEILPSKEVDDLVAKSYRWGGFFAITYNITTN